MSPAKNTITYCLFEIKVNSIIMECQKISYLLEKTLNQPSKPRTENWVELNNESRGTYNVNSEIRFKTSMLRLRLCDYSVAYILVSATIAVTKTAGAGAAGNNRKNIFFKICALFTNPINETNNAPKDNAKNIDLAMPMYNLIE